MNNFASIDLISNNVKTLVDNCRCVSCDRLNIKRYRYSCGHSLCEDCIEINNTSCGLCSPTVTSISPIIDVPQSERVQHVSELLDTFHSSFNVDVYRKQRLSNKIKIEKELFPECIQAPIKYYNKRKSSILTEKDDKRASLLPGESISSGKIKMKKPNDYVQQWLNQTENSFPKAKARLPLSDLSTSNSNSVNLCNVQKEPVIHRKRKLSKSGCKPKNKKTETIKKLKSQIESGIELDTIINSINESKEQDKDRLAQLAVLEADAKQNQSDDSEATKGHTKHMADFTQKDYIFKPLQSHEYENRLRPKVRGKTPASSDSSDKENYNPNRKRRKINSKCKKK